jgi:hypothetical protein
MIMGATPGHYLTQADLAKTRTTEESDVILPSGGRIRVRGLTRTEHLWIGKGTEDAGTIEARLLSKGMVEPPMTIPAAQQWQNEAGTRDVSAASDKIRDLSGFGQGAAKSVVDEV